METSYKVPEYMVGEFRKLTSLGQSQLILIMTTVDLLVSGNNLEDIFQGLDYTQGQFLKLRDECKAKGLTNIDKYLGRKYNMFINTPKSFEHFQGRIYSVGL